MTGHSTDPDGRLAKVSAALRAWLRLPQQEADDFVQEAWRLAFRYGPDLWTLSDGGLLGYLKRCAVSAISHRARKSNDALRHVVARLAEEIDAEAGEAGVPALADIGDDPFARAASADAVRAIHAALARLGPDQRLRLTLSCMYELSSEEVGRILRCSPSSVDNSNTRARARLRTLLPELGHLGSGAELPTGTLWFPGGARIDLTVLRQETRALAAGASTFLSLEASDAAELRVAECWAIAHLDRGRVAPPTRALWSATLGARGEFTLQIPALDDVGTGVRELHVFAGPFPGA